jgi:hypothetical protein
MYTPNKKHGISKTTEPKSTGIGSVWPKTRTAGPLATTLISQLEEMEMVMVSE